MPEPARAPSRLGLLKHHWWRILVLLAASLAVGLLAGVVWPRVTTLPGYVVQEDGSAVTTEYGLTQFIAADASFSLIGVLAGVGIGVAWWWALGPRHPRPGIGWPVVVFAVLSAALAGVVCWQTGEALGAQDFDDRLRAAAPGDLVTIDFTLRSLAALVLWPFGAAAALVAIGAIAPDREEPRPLGSAGNPGGGPGGRAQQVGGSQFHLQSSASSRDHDQLMVQCRGVEHGRESTALTDGGDATDDIAGAPGGC